MKKFVSFLVALALVVGFSACEKEASEVLDDFDVNIKGSVVMELQDQEGYITAYTWGGITASEFAKGQTPPFNNWTKLLGDGIAVYRSPKKVEDGWKQDLIDQGIKFLTGQDKPNQFFGNGKDPVWLWFDAEDWKAIVE